MSVPWAKNFFGVRQSDFELLQVPNPKLELGLHITIKTVQTGTLLGSLFVGPLVQAFNGPRDSHSMRRAVINGGWIGAGVGLVAGPIFAVARISNLKTIGVYDRLVASFINRSFIVVEVCTPKEYCYLDATDCASTRSSFASTVFSR